MRRFSPFFLLLLLAACQPESAAPPGENPTAAAVAEPAKLALPLKDVMERTPNYLVGITYPAVASEHPKLAEALHAYAEDARKDLMDAVGLITAEGQPAGTTYDLSLNFTELMNKPEAVVIAVDGSLYTGGAHGIPLIARFTYLPQEDRMLAPADLIPERSGWEAVSEYVRQELDAQVKARLEEDEVPEADRAEISRNARGMIEEGTLPDAENFAQFEPIPAADGKWFGLRFVFPPYQVGPYSDGTQSVEVPVAVLRPHLAGKYRVMFTGG